MAAAERRSKSSGGNGHPTQASGRAGHPAAHGNDGEVQFEGRDQTGEVVRVMGDKGFGFIRLAAGTEVFFHRSGFQNPATFETLRPGDHVSCKVQQGPKGLRAFDVQVI